MDLYLLYWNFFHNFFIFRKKLEYIRFHLLIENEYAQSKKEREFSFFFHTNLLLILRNSKTYNKRVTKMRDIVGDGLDLFDRVVILKVDSLSLMN